MTKPHKERLLQICATLITDAEKVKESKFDTGVIGSPTYVDTQPLHQWWGRVKSFGHQLGKAAKPWKEHFEQEPERNTLGFVKKTQGVLEGIHYEIENDHLDSFTQLVKAETLADLIEQGEHLLEAGYYIAAGVVGRAVLEQHLRELCESHACYPKKKKPTLNDFNQALYGLELYSKTKMKHIDSLASVGNDAAHNKPELEATDVKRMLQDIPSIIESTNV